MFQFVLFDILLDLRLFSFHYIGANMDSDDDDSVDALQAFNPSYIAFQLFSLADDDDDEGLSVLYIRAATALLTLQSVVSASLSGTGYSFTINETEGDEELEDMECKGNG